MAERSALSDFKVMGMLWKVARKADGCTYALTEIPVTELTRKAQEAAIQAVRVLSKLTSKHVLTYYDSFIEKEKLFVVTGYASGGSLSQWIATKGPTGLPEATAWRILIQLCLALRSIHAQSIMHRDIRPLNIFLDNTGSIMVGNFGLARLQQGSEDLAKTIVGAPLYMSPELCSGSSYDEKTDMWALGVVMYECCTGKNPFMASNMPALATQIHQFKPPPINRETYSEDLRSTISLLLSVEAASRPSAQDVLKLPSVKQQSAQLCIQLEDNTLQASARVTRQSTDKATLVTGGLSQKGPTRTRVSKEPPAQPKSPEGTKGTSRPSRRSSGSKLVKPISSVSNTLSALSTGKHTVDGSEETAAGQGITDGNEGYISDTDVEDVWSVDEESTNDGSSPGKAMAKGSSPRAAAPRNRPAGRKPTADIEDAQGPADWLQGQKWMQEVADELDCLQLENQSLGNSKGAVVSSDHSGMEKQYKPFEQEGCAMRPCSVDKRPSTTIDEQTGLERACV